MNQHHNHITTEEHQRAEQARRDTQNHVQHEHPLPSADQAQHGHVHANHAAQQQKTNGTHTGHADHMGHMDHPAHDEHMGHVGHGEAMFQRPFWISLVLTIPILFYAELFQNLLGYRAPAFPGSQYL
ncbi:MAG: hypothetical protein IMW89_02485, partial [Ktedonobacteraceae bacterium]|nr:hypothetical protein [Ktedonobacteraceae bacterium]